MIIQHNKVSCEKGLIETGVIKNTNGNMLMFRVRQVGSILKVNPPPEDMCCEICGRKKDDLETFDQEFCAAMQDGENEIEKLYPNCVLKYITADHKLAKNFRSFYQEPVYASWECKKCIPLSTEEAIEHILEHS